MKCNHGFILAVETLDAKCNLATFNSILHGRTNDSKRDLNAIGMIIYFALG